MLRTHVKLLSKFWERAIVFFLLSTTIWDPKGMPMGEEHPPAWVLPASLPSCQPHLPVFIIITLWVPLSFLLPYFPFHFPSSFYLLLLLLLFFTQWAAGGANNIKIFQRQRKLHKSWFLVGIIPNNLVSPVRHPRGCWLLDYFVVLQ